MANLADDWMTCYSLMYNEFNNFLSYNTVLEKKNHIQCKTGKYIIETL